jgi:hypothetical protein
MTRDPVLMHAANAQAAQRRYGIPASVILGLLAVEGGTDEHGRPVKPADGAGPPSYGQFTFGTGRSLHVRYGDSSSEVDAVARYLLQLGWGKDPTRAIAAYNGGPGNPQYGYAAKVQTAAKRYVSFDSGGGANPLHLPAPPAGAGVEAGGSLLDAQQHSTLVRFGVTAALVLVAVAAVVAGVSRAAGVRSPLAGAAKAGAS